MKETAKLLKLKTIIKSFENERDSQSLYLIGQYSNLSKEIELATTPAQAERNVTDVAYYLRKIYDIAREQIEKFSENESAIINKYKKVCNFFIGASASPIFSLFLKKIDNDFLNSKVLTESFFLDLAREMLSINKVKQKEKDAKENEIISSDPALSILEQLEMIIVLKDHDEASKCLSNCKGFIDELKSNVQAGFSQSTFQMSRELAKPLQCLFEIAKNNKLYAICDLFKDFADIEKQSKPCVSNCVKVSQSTSEKLALSVAKVILQEEGFFDARPTGSHTQPEFRFSKYHETFSPVLEQRFFTTPTSSAAPSFSEALAFHNSLTK